MGITRGLVRKWKIVARQMVENADRGNDKKKKQDGEGLIILMIKRSKTKSINNGKKFAVIMTGTQISSHLPET